jgi:ABC-type lipoprotein release transport system permease subunit
MWYWRWAMGTPMRYVPYGVEATDALVYVLIAVTLGSAGFLACFLPARAAARADPVETMRVY